MYVASFRATTKTISKKSITNLVRNKRKQNHKNAKTREGRKREEFFKSAMNRKQNRKGRD